MSAKPLLQRISELVSQYPDGFNQKCLHDLLPHDQVLPAMIALDQLCERGFIERRQVRNSIAWRFHSLKPYEPGRRDPTIDTQAYDPYRVPKVRFRPRP